MSESVAAAFIALTGVVISVASSSIVSLFQNRSELAKIKKELEQQYAKQLFEKRIEAYPKLYQLISSYAKTIQYGEQTIENFLNFRESIDSWDSQNAIFFTESTARIAGKFRGYLYKILSDKDPSSLSNEDWADIKQMMRGLETALRSEIGSYTLDPVYRLEEASKIWGFIDEKKLAKLNSKKSR
jgi:hypothetical protein